MLLLTAKPHRYVGCEHVLCFRCIDESLEPLEPGVVCTCPLCEEPITSPPIREVLLEVTIAWAKGARGEEFTFFPVDHDHFDIYFEMSEPT